MLQRFSNAVASSCLIQANTSLGAGKPGSRDVGAWTDYMAAVIAIGRTDLNHLLLFLTTKGSKMPKDQFFRTTVP